MRVGKSQCSIFKDLYEAFLQGEIEDETRTWMEEHVKECSHCSEWSKNHEKDEKDKVIDTSVQKDMFDEAKDVIKKTKLIVSIGMGLIVFIAIWMSVWIGT
ncbi:zf-HC2 domain-containing protein [Candidatus Clostridium stratigraminis]|uniref:Zf-HC2 domain-containing protein n=1 Tax=Candidatus Clostridium stratigraminis TaxID=3381661 RepID=A0ABW8T882_9CLOT